MRSFLGGLAVITLVGWVGFGAGFSGEWNSGMSFTDGSASFTNTFTLHLSFSGWELESTWVLATPEFSSHSLTFQGALGLIDYEAGLSFHIAGSELSRTDTGWAMRGLTWTGGDLTLELPIGDFTLRLTLVTAPPAH